MKRQALFGLLALFLCISNGDAQGTPTFFSRVLVSGDGARVVFEHSPFEETSAPIKIYNAKTHRKTGQISRARRLMSVLSEDGKPRFQFEELSVEALSADGCHLLVRRLPLSKFTQDQIPQSYNPKNEPFLEAWNIAETPRLKWRKRGIHFSDVQWVQGQIVVLFQKEVQRWNENGKVVSRLSLAKFSVVGNFGRHQGNTLSSDGGRAVISTNPLSVIETRRGRLLQKLNMRLPEQPVDFMFGPKNRYIWGSGLMVIDGTVASDQSYIWSTMDSKVQNGSPQNPIFSPDGSAFWNDWNFRFESIATGKPASLRAPTPFTNKTAFLQAISDNGRVWAGLNTHSEPFWVITR